MLNEVAPPGFGHTKGDKKKGVKRGGTAAAFDRARKEGRFKGSKSDMFAIMWSQKKKGDKPHYKPGTDKKYKKYQDESVKDPTKKKPKAPQFNAAKELVTDAPYMKPALQQREATSYKQYMADVQAAKDRLKKKIEDRKKKAISYRDMVTQNMEKEKKRQEKMRQQEAERKQALAARKAMKDEIKRELEQERDQRGSE